MVPVEGDVEGISRELGTIAAVVAAVVFELGDEAAGSFPEGERLSGCGVTPAVVTVKGGAGLWRARRGSLMHLRLGVVQWAMFVALFSTHSVRLDVPALRLKPELQMYRSLEYKL